jgi:hypothetical protein
MAHELAGALQQAGRIWQRCALKESHVYVRSEYIDVTEGRISQTCHRTAVMQKFPDFVPAFSHHLKPLMRDGSQFTCMLFHPRIDGGIPLDSTVESQQFRSHRSTSRSADHKLAEASTGLSSGSEPIFAGTGLHSLKSTSALLPKLSQKAAASPGLWNQRGCSLMAF